MISKVGESPGELKYQTEMCNMIILFESIISFNYMRRETPTSGASPLKTSWPIKIRFAQLIPS
jgi:hypothetical protein